MINNYFYHITISDGRLYCYNFKRKSYCQSMFTFAYAPTECNIVVTHIARQAGSWGYFSVPHLSDRLASEPNYLADILDDIIDEALRLKELPNTHYPEIATFTLRQIN
jgi:hypothetical protein